MVLPGKKRVRDMIDHLDYDELLKLRRDLDEGGLHLLRLVNKKIKEFETEHKKYCSTCGAELDENTSNNYTLVFGPYDFRKRASFCGVDCMEQFIQKLKDIRSFSDDYMSSWAP
ncbi:MAG: hypothetical protein ACLFTR_00500 [Candidatus Woesearchaeota archaeon]